MVLPLAIALMAAGGYRKYKQDQVDEQDAAEAAQARREDRAFTLGERARIVKQRDREGQLADMQLDEAQAAHLNKLFDDNLQKLGTHDDIARVISESTLGGNLKVKAVPTGDGKRVEYHRINEDGSTTPTGQSFQAGDRGVLEAKLVMGRMTPVSQKLDYLHKQSTAEQTQANVDREFTRKTGESDRDYELSKKEADRRAKHDSAMLSNDNARVGIARMAASAKAATGKVEGASPGLGLKDMREFEDDVFKRLGPEFDPKNAESDAQRAQIAAARNEIATRASGVFRINGERGMPVTAEVALNALKMASNKANVREMAGSDGMAYPVVVINGGPVIVGPGKPPQRAAAPTQPAAPGAAPAAAMPAPAVPAAPAAPAGQVAAAVPFQQFVAQNITTTYGKELIRQRIEKELPELQTKINGATQVMAMPLVSGAIKAKLKAQIEGYAQEAQMMQAFIEGNGAQPINPRF